MGPAQLLVHASVLPRDVVGFFVLFCLRCGTLELFEMHDCYQFVYSISGSQKQLELTS